MKEIKKITIKEFVTQYNNRVPQMQESYLKDNLVITNYVPFIKKDTLAQNLVDISTYKYEDYDKGDGTIGRRKTDIIKVNSTVQYLLFCRLIIENYTNLEIETEGFFEEYDLLKQSGLLDKLMVGDENDLPLIPVSEISEMRTIVEMKQKDEITNRCEIHNYISSQVTRFGELTGIVLKPVLEKITTNLENMTEEDAEKLGNKLDKVFKRVK